MTENRQEQRYRCSALVRYGSKGNYHVGIISDVSNSGLRLLLQPESSLGNRLELRPLSREPQVSEVCSGTIAWRLEDEMTGRRQAGVRVECPGWVSNLFAEAQSR